MLVTLVLTILVFNEKLSLKRERTLESYAHHCAASRGLLFVVTDSFQRASRGNVRAKGREHRCPGCGRKRSRDGHDHVNLSDLESIRGVKIPSLESRSITSSRLLSRGIDVILRSYRPNIGERNSPSDGLAFRLVLLIEGLCEHYAVVGLVSIHVVWLLLIGNRPIAHKHGYVSVGLIAEGPH